MKKISYKCPDCENKIEYGDKFCKNCSCKLDWDDEAEERNIEDMLNKKITRKEKNNSNRKDNKDNSITIALWLLLFQFIAIFGSVIQNDYFDFGDADQIFQMLGFHSFLILAIILMIKNRDLLFKSVKKPFFIVMSLLILLFLSLSIVFGIKGVNVLGDEHKNEEPEKNDSPRARHILVSSKVKAQTIIIKLNNGEDFCSLAKEYSQDGSSGNCGDIGYFEYGDMVEEFEEAFKKLDIGEYTDYPVETEYGYHIIMRMN